MISAACNNLRVLQTREWTADVHTHAHAHTHTYDTARTAISRHTALQARRSGVPIPAWVRYRAPLETWRPALRLSQHPVQRVSQLLSGSKAAEAWYRPSSAKVQNEWICTSITCLNGVSKDNFTFTSLCSSMFVFSYKCVYALCIHSWMWTQALSQSEFGDLLDKPTRLLELLCLDRYNDRLNI